MPILDIPGLDDAPAWDVVPDFSGGQFSNARANLIQPNQCALMENFDISITGQLMTRRGTLQLGDNFGETIQGLADYVVPSAHQFVAAAGGILRQWNGAAFTSPVYGLSNSTPVVFVQGHAGDAGPVLFIAQSDKPLAYYNGTIITAVSTGAVPEVTEISFGTSIKPPTAVSDLNGLHLLLADEDAVGITPNVWVYFDVVEISVIPPVLILPERIIIVPLHDTMTSGEIITATAAAINADAKFNAAAAYISVPSPTTVSRVVVTAATGGARIDGNKGTSPMTVTVLTQGANELNRPPENMSLLVWHTERLIGSGIAAYPDTILFSAFLDGTYWDQVNWTVRVGASDGEPITGIVPWTNYNLLVLKQHSTWIVGCDPQTQPSQFQINRIHDRIGSLSPKTACQVGTDIFFLTDTHQVHSVKNIIASEQQKEVGQPLSYPVQDILDRLNDAAVATANAFHWKNRYILAIPIDGATQPNYVLVFNTLTNSWSGGWTGLSPTYMIARKDGNVPKLAIGQASGTVVDWMDYIPDSQKTLTAFKDAKVDIPCRMVTRSLIWNEPVCPKTGECAEFEFNKSSADVVASVIRDDSAKEVFESFATLQNSLSLPVDLPVDLPKAGITRKAFDLARYDPFRELQFELESTSGEVILRSVSAMAYVDSVELETA